jgi:hypothetical protein
MSDTLPDWPPPDDEPIGIERPRASIAWIREHALPVVAEAEAMLAERCRGISWRNTSKQGTRTAPSQVARFRIEGWWPSRAATGGVFFAEAIRPRESGGEPLGGVAGASQ